MAGTGFLNTTFPVQVPRFEELFFPSDAFNASIETLLRSSNPVVSAGAEEVKPESKPSKDEVEKPSEQRRTAPFMNALLAHSSTVPSLDARDGKMLTRNGDVAYKDSGESLVNLFHELEDGAAPARLERLLANSWKTDPTATLKIIWNARSIHLGKSSRNSFYRAVGWLAQNHPHTLIANLPWLVRPVIEKKASKDDNEKSGESTNDNVVLVDRTKRHDDDEEEEEEEEFELVDATDANDHPAKKAKLEEPEAMSAYDIKYGVAHGYWKDLLNILMLAANNELTVGGNIRAVLNPDAPKSQGRSGTLGKHNPAYRDPNRGTKKDRVIQRHARVTEKLQNDAFFKALYLSVAHLFAEQLTLDRARLESGDKAEIKRISLAAKWAPSNKGMHDEHTFIVSTIAERLYPFETVCPDGIDPADRTTYLKHARAAYQATTLSPLRKQIDIVERPISANRFSDIKFDRIPSLAMARYTNLFIEKDQEHFEQYVNAVAEGKVRVSGATLLPSTLVAAARQSKSTSGRHGIEQRIRWQAANGQWNTLVQRIRDSGTLASAIAVCDVSGSMSHPVFPDGTCPMDTAIGLSLLLAEVCEAPFGGAFITFSAEPEVMHVGGKSDHRSFQEKVDYISVSEWGMNTNFVSVFEKLILPLAIENKLKQEDMVKKVFVFSDMHFDKAQRDNADSWPFSSGGMTREGESWAGSFERIRKKYKQAGYDMPELVFWNIAGGHPGYGASNDHSTAPKPVQAHEKGTALVSGYSQAMMKVFLDGGSFDEKRDDEDEMVEIAKDGREVTKEKEQMTPLRVVRKAISHEAYRMLKVVD